MKRRNLATALNGKTVLSVERDKNGFRIVFTDRTSIFISEDSLFDQDGNYFDTSRVK